MAQEVALDGRTIAAIAPPTPPSAPVSEEYTLAANTPLIISARGSSPITVHIKTGTTADVLQTCSTDAEVVAGTADWVDWPNGAKAGPFMDTLLYPVTAIKLVSVVGGTVYLMRGRK